MAHSADPKRRCLPNLVFGVRDALVCALRMMSSSNNYERLPNAEEKLTQFRSHTVHPPDSVYSQLFDTLLCVCDVATVAAPAFFSALSSTTVV
jgi:hypothetical protein